MCGRFTLTVDPADLQEAYPQYTIPAEGQPRYNIAPTQPVLVLPNDKTARADYFSWGLIPSWAKDPSIGAKLINARAETLAEKPSFRGGFKYKRCLIFADGFFEWQAQPGSKAKIPHFIHLKSGLPFTFAGLWDAWHAPDGSLLKTCTIITTEPNALMVTLHNRMPVILPPEVHAEWLDPAPKAPQNLQHLLTPYPAEEMAAHPVSTLVNSPAVDRPELVIVV